MREKVVKKLSLNSCTNIISLSFLWVLSRIIIPSVEFVTFDGVLLPMYIQYSLKQHLNYTNDETIVAHFFENNRSTVTTRSYFTHKNSWSGVTTRSRANLRCLKITFRMMMRIFFGEPNHSYINKNLETCYTINEFSTDAFVSKLCMYIIHYCFSNTTHVHLFKELCYLNIHLYDNFLDNQNFTKKMKYRHKNQSNKERK